MSQCMNKSSGGLRFSAVQSSLWWLWCSTQQAKSNLCMTERGERRAGTTRVQFISHFRHRQTYRRQQKWLNWADIKYSSTAFSSTKSQIHRSHLSCMKKHKSSWSKAEEKNNIFSFLWNEVHAGAHRRSSESCSTHRSMKRKRSWFHFNPWNRPVRDDLRDLFDSWALSRSERRCGARTLKTRSWTSEFTRTHGRSWKTAQHAARHLLCKSSATGQTRTKMMKTDLQTEQTKCHYYCQTDCLFSILVLNQQSNHSHSSSGRYSLQKTHQVVGWNILTSADCK